MYPVTYPRYPGRFAAVVFLSAGVVFGGYWITSAFRSLVVPAAPEAGPAGLELVAVGTMTSPQAQTTFSPEWQPKVEPLEVKMPEPPPIDDVLTPSLGDLKAWGVLSRPGRVQEIGPEVRISIGETTGIKPEVHPWSLQAEAAAPPTVEVPKPELDQMTPALTIPSPPIKEYIGPRLLPEMLIRGKAVVPSHPVKEGLLLKP